MDKISAFFVRSAQQRAQMYNFRKTSLFLYKIPHMYSAQNKTERLNISKSLFFAYTGYQIRKERDERKQ